ncbi:RluA family pseudouridine synthase [bacterium AH-315-J21]|nr:RluA family pseudouridine synthase [bacterium AH-315-J21]
MNDNSDTDNQSDTDTGKSKANCILVEVPTLDEPLRIDKFLADRAEIGTTRSQIQRALKSGQVSVDGVVCVARFKVAGGEKIEITLPEVITISSEPEDIPLDIVYEDEHLLVVNKPVGMVTHPAPGATSGTLVNALLSHTRILSEMNGRERAGIVHRLDKNTGGLLVVAKTEKTHLALQEMIGERSLKRRYRAIICGHMIEQEKEIDLAIARSHKDRRKMAVVAEDSKGARRAVTHYKLLERFRSHDYLELELETGRTHQIRVHLSHLGHPVFGDPEYGGRESWHKGLFGPDRLFGDGLLKHFPSQALHARELQFTHPVTAEEVHVICEPDEAFLHVLQEMRIRT